MGRGSIWAGEDERGIGESIFVSIKFCDSQGPGAKCVARSSRGVHSNRLHLERYHLYLGVSWPRGPRGSSHRPAPMIIGWELGWPYHLARLSGARATPFPVLYRPNNFQNLELELSAGSLANGRTHHYHALAQGVGILLISMDPAPWHRLIAISQFGCTQHVGSAVLVTAFSKMNDASTRLQSHQEECPLCGH